MRRSPTALALSVAVAWLLGAETALAQKPRAERPNYDVGARWLLNDGAYDLVRATGDVYFFSAGPTRQIQLTRDLGIYRMLKDGNVECQGDPPPPIKWPLEVGKWGIIHNAILRSREYPSGLPVRFTWEVKAYESVQVPGGTYQAFRIVYLAEYDTGDPLRRSSVIAGRQSWGLVSWYAPEARQIVKAEGSGLSGVDFQLVAGDSVASAPPQVVLNDPKDQVRVSSAETPVGGKVTAVAGVARVTATLNGAEIFARAERTPAPQEVGLTFSLPLREGKNVLLVTATDARGQSRQEARVIFRDRPVAPPAAPGPAPVVPAPPAAAASPLPAAISSPKEPAPGDP